MDSVDSSLESNEIHKDLIQPISDPPQLESAESIKKNPKIPAIFLGKIKKIWDFSRENTIRIRTCFESVWKKYFCADQVKRTRAYQVWPGNNVFFFQGRLVCGPNPRGLILTTFSIVLSSWIFSVYVAAGDLRSVAFSVILTIIVLVNLMLVSTTDPGIIPRNEELSVEFGSKDMRRRRRRRRISITVNGTEVQLKYCLICNIYRPPRSSHCVVCNNCVHKFDHHCPWIGQCIGLRNYRFYLTFLAVVFVFFGYMFVFCCRRASRALPRSGGASLFGMLKNKPEILALGLFSFVALAVLVGLAFYHLYLITINQTSYEYFRGRYVESRNPYDKGIWSNVKEVLFVPLPPPSIDFSAQLVPQLH